MEAPKWFKKAYVKIGDGLSAGYENTKMDFRSAQNYLSGKKLTIEKYAEFSLLGFSVPLTLGVLGGGALRLFYGKHIEGCTPGSLGECNYQFINNISQWQNFYLSPMTLALAAVYGPVLMRSAPILSKNISKLGNKMSDAHKKWKSELESSLYSIR